VIGRFERAPQLDLQPLKFRRGDRRKGDVVNQFVVTLLALRLFIPPVYSGTAPEKVEILSNRLEFNLPLNTYQTQPLEPKQPLNQDWECWVEKRPISGDVRVGIMAGEGLDAAVVSPDVFTVFLPASELPLLCVGVSSQDGRYNAKLEYDVKGVRPGRVKFRLPTKYKKEISQYKAGELAILSQLNERCGAKTRMYALSSWSDQASTDSVSIFVNSRAHTDVTGNVNGNERTQPCEDIRGKSSVAYNLRCVIPGSWVTHSSEFVLRIRLIEDPSITYNYRDLPLKLR
jgi:hypothetical protein